MISADIIMDGRYDSEGVEGRPYVLDRDPGEVKIKALDDDSDSVLVILYFTSYTCTCKSTPVTVDPRIWRFSFCF